MKLLKEGHARAKSNRTPSTEHASSSGKGLEGLAEPIKRAKEWCYGESPLRYRLSGIISLSKRVSILRLDQNHLKLLLVASGQFPACFKSLLAMESFPLNSDGLVDRIDAPGSLIMFALELSFSVMVEGQWHNGDCTRLSVERGRKSLNRYAANRTNEGIFTPDDRLSLNRPFVLFANYSGYKVSSFRSSPFSRATSCPSSSPIGDALSDSSRGRFNHPLYDMIHSVEKQISKKQARVEEEFSTKSKPVQPPLLSIRLLPDPITAILRL
ncbi:CHASE domain containing histidine kinase protein [Striga asiatica]|uniref:CHASE domain containing histidine kinase protein n=1 Tax=Striga asiatica TaxID=4170 RepID=A0A5A7Q2K3_STRAF|nr:CHASE domain containing histidine kinase protein [Striga asiatica]